MPTMQDTTHNLLLVHIPEIWLDVPEVNRVRRFDYLDLGDLHLAESKVPFECHKHLCREFICPRHLYRAKGDLVTVHGIHRRERERCFGADIQLHRNLGDDLVFPGMNDTEIVFAVVTDNLETLICQVYLVSLSIA